MVLLVDFLERQDHVDVVEGLDGGHGRLLLHLLDLHARDVVLSVSVGIIDVELTVGNVRPRFDTLVHVLEVLRCGFLLQTLRFEGLGRHHALGARLGGVVEGGRGPSHRHAPSRRQGTVVAFGGQLLRLVFPCWQRAPEGMCVRFLVDRIIEDGRLEHLVLPTGLPPGVDGEAGVLALLEWLTRCRCGDSGAVCLYTVLPSALAMLGARADQLGAIQSLPEGLLQRPLIHGSLLSFGFDFLGVKELVGISLTKQSGSHVGAG